MSTAWLLDLSADSLQLELTIDDVMADLDPSWIEEAKRDDEVAA